MRSIINSVCLTVLSTAVSFGALGVIDGDDTVKVFNTGQGYPLGFISATDGLRMFRFSDVTDGALEDLVLDTHAGSLFVGQRGGNSPDPALLCVGIEAGASGGNITLRIAADHYDTSGAPPVRGLDTVLTKNDFSGAYSYGKQDFKPYFAKDSTGLPLATGLTGKDFKLLFLDLGVHFTAGVLDYACLHYNINTDYSGSVALNMYGYSATDGAVKWTNPTAVLDTTSSCLITVSATGMNPYSWPGINRAYKTCDPEPHLWNLTGSPVQAGHHRPLPAGVYLVRDGDGRVSKLLVMPAAQ